MYTHAHAWDQWIESSRALVLRGYYIFVSQLTYKWEKGTGMLEREEL
jgi:hypothetical protein